ncbi:MAG: hypothetical protein J7J25_00165 [Candidatus Omnitrophica bacterium]|nr:hypothetical protein [Candidatus Omnitrophota bacterium]
MFCKRVFERIIEQESQVLLGWRKVPVDNSDIGEGAGKSEPVIEQIFIMYLNLPRLCPGNTREF